MNWISFLDNKIVVPVQRNNRPGITNAIHTVNHIVENYPPPYLIFASGGLDSQAVIYSWLKSGHDFQVVSIRYNDNLNDHDLKALKQFANKYKFPVHWIDFDVLEFLESEVLEYQERYKCGSPHVCTHMKMSELVDDGTRIFSGDPMFNGSSGCFPDHNVQGLFRYKLFNQDNRIVPSFFLETIEMAWGMNPVTGNGNDIISDNKKWENMVKCGFEVIDPGQKYTGFEKIKDLYDQEYAHLVTPKDRMIRNRGQGSKRVFDLLLRNKYEVKYRKEYPVSVTFRRSNDK